MKLIPTWPIAVGCLVIGVVAGAGADHLWMNSEVTSAKKDYTDLVGQNQREAISRNARRALEEASARSREQELAARAGQIEQEKENEISRIRTDYDSAIARLQHRPDRKPAAASSVPGATPACQGATGVELSRADAGFLVGEAARADEQREALRACYAAYDSVLRANNN